MSSSSPAEEVARYLGAKVAEIDASKLVPMLCEREEASERVLSRAGWLFELKLDGVRIVADKRGSKVRLFYRKQREATESYREVVDAVRDMVDERVVLDGEIVAFDAQGRPDFQKLGHRIQTKSSNRFVQVVYAVFDVLAVGPYDLRSFPLEARKEILKRVLPESSGVLRPHPTFESGVELYKLCRENRLEGVVAKRLGTSYKVGERSTDWLKIKCEIDAEFVVIGWTEGESDRARLGALDLGAYEGDRLVFRGRVGSGLHGEMIDKLLAILEPIEVNAPVAEGKYSPKPKRHHCLPQLVVSVRYGGFSLDPSGARFLRFPVFRGIRADVDPKDCTAAPEEESPPSGAPRIHVTAPTTALFRDGTTKEALCKYFETAAPVILRHVKGRACSFLKPDGSTLWPPPKWTPKFAKTTTLKAGPREIRGFVVDSLDTLLFSVEAGSPCLHHGPYLEERADQADFVVVRVSGPAKGKAALAVRDIAEKIGLPAVAKVSGADAIDVLIGIGFAPVAAAAPLGTLIAHLVPKADGVKVQSVESTPSPFTMCPTGVLALPIPWEAIEEEIVPGLGEIEDSAVLDAIANATVDVATATAAIERLVVAGLK